MDKKTTHAVIDMMESQKKVKNKGGTMRLGAYRCDLKPGSISEGLYKSEHISERHRHRYEFNNNYLEQFENAGLVAVGKNPDNNLVEVVELPSHPFFVGVQYHPELKSTVDNPHPLFVGLIKAALDHKNGVKKTVEVNRAVEAN
jgi:CTP synthase